MLGKCTPSERCKHYVPTVSMMAAEHRIVVYGIHGVFRGQCQPTSCNSQSERRPRKPASCQCCCREATACGEPREHHGSSSALCRPQAAGC